MWAKDMRAGLLIHGSERKSYYILLKQEVRGGTFFARNRKKNREKQIERDAEKVIISPVPFSL